MAVECNAVKQLFPGRHLMEMFVRVVVFLKSGTLDGRHRTDNRIRSPRLVAYGSAGEGLLGNSANWTRNFGIRVASSCVMSLGESSRGEVNRSRAVRLFSKYTAMRWPSGFDTS